MNMERKSKKIIVLIGILFVPLALYLFIQRIRCSIEITASQERLIDYNHKSVQLSYGDMTYLDIGEGVAILSIHGIFGGYDQAYETCKDICSDFRIIAPSRFGYLGSDILNTGTPADQGKAFKELLQKLNIETVYVLATSAGGTVGIRFALDYPELVKGLILYCSAMPYSEKPKSYIEFAGPPTFMVNDYFMFAISPFFEVIMGMEPQTIYSMMPIKNRQKGVYLDSVLINPDMARNFDDYKIEDIKIPTLVFQAKDDKLVNYKDTENVISRFTNHKIVLFETGGHLMRGHSDEIRNAVLSFINENNKSW